MSEPDSSNLNFSPAPQDITPTEAERLAAEAEAKRLLDSGIINNYYPGDKWEDIDAPDGPPPILVSATFIENRITIDMRGAKLPKVPEGSMDQFRGKDIDNRVARTFRVLESGLKCKEHSKPYIKVGYFDHAVKYHMNIEDVQVIQTFQKRIPPIA